jgi:hypothetical protein
MHLEPKRLHQATAAASASLHTSQIAVSSLPLGSHRAGMPPHHVFMQHIPILFFRRGVIWRFSDRYGVQGSCFGYGRLHSFNTTGRAYFYSTIFEKGLAQR